ncbi:hypothetical protein ACOMHN_019453 [Nucella lapillus]
MIRLLSTSVVLVLVATLILDSEALFKRPNKLCCVRRNCTVDSKLYKCCGIGRVCRGRFGYLKGRCVRRKCVVKSGRDVDEEPEGDDIDALVADP